MYEEEYEAETPFVRLTPETHDMLERENAKGNFYVRKSDLKKTSFSDHNMEAYLFTATDY